MVMPNFSATFSTIVLIISAVAIIVSAVIETNEKFTFSGHAHHRNLALHHAVKEMLNFKNTGIAPISSSLEKPNSQPQNFRGNFNKNAKTNPASYYMKELFKKWYQSHNSGEDALKSKVVRSIAPKIVVNSAGRAALSFNLQALRPSERLIKAELHFNAAGLFVTHKNQQYRRTKKITRNAKIRCFALLQYQNFTLNGSKHHQTVELPQKSQERLASSLWLIFDAMLAVKSFTELIHLSSHNNSSSANRLVITFALDGYVSPKHHTINWARKLLLRHSPFLLLFTEDKQQESMDNNKRFMTSLLSSSHFLYKTQYSGNGNTKIKDNSPSGMPMNRAKRYVGKSSQNSENNIGGYNAKYYQYSYLEGHNANKIEKYDGQHQENNHFTSAYIQKGPAILQDSKAARRNKKMKARKNYYHQHHRSKKYRSSKNMLPPADNYNHEPFGQPTKQRQQRSKNDVTAHLGQSETSKGGAEVQQNLHNSTPKQAKQRYHQDTLVLMGSTKEASCRKRDLVVEFRDIGWSDWIIAPKSFEAHYCAGTCLFPLSAKSNPSNHAIIQSIVHAAGIHPGVPEITCAPDKMDSLTLLYFDEDQNVVLKNYPKMTVSSCSCL